MENILKDKIKFEKVDLKARTLNFQVNREKRVNETLKSLKSAGSLSVYRYKKMKVVGSRSFLFYVGICEVHKAIVDVCSPFKPILSAIEITTYKIAKFLLPMLSCLTISEFTLKT